MEKIIKFSKAFDERHPDPKKNYGIHGVDLRMVLKGELGAVQFVLYTQWHLPGVREELKLKDRILSEPLPADVGYHSPIPQYEGQETLTDSCEYLDGKPCYYDGSGLMANDAFDVLTREGCDGLWKYLEDKYESTFGELK